MPNADVNPLSDVLVLQDCSLVAFRWEGTNNAPGSRVVRWDEARSQWAEVATESLYTGTDQDWAQGADGRIYSFETVIDPYTRPWQVDPFELAYPDEPYAGAGLDAGADGRIYRPLTRLSFMQLTFEIYDPVLDARETSPSLAKPYYPCILGSPDRRVLAMNMNGFAFYDPNTGSWSETTSTPAEMDCEGAGFGPDGRLYMASTASSNDIRAYDVETRAWSAVEPPPSGEAFRPRFITGPDGRLWAIGQHESFIFTPDS